MADEQWQLEGRLECGEQVEWEARCRALMDALAADLQHRGLTPDHAPDVPVAPDLRSAVVGPFRLLCAYSAFAVTGWDEEQQEPIMALDPHYRIRVDTIAK